MSKPDYDSESLPESTESDSNTTKLSHLRVAFPN
ncbi:MAG: hypothetical protein ACI843_002408 [Psychrobacter glaciei]|jgi:hypothetical protein